MSSSSATTSTRVADSASSSPRRPTGTLQRALILAVGILSASLLGAQSFTEFTVTTPGSGPGGIAAGPDGNLWFTEEIANKIGRITPAGVITEFPVGGGEDVDPVAIVAGPDGNLWFTLYLGDQIGQITPAGVITIFDLPFTNHGALHIAAGPDGNLWFTELLRNRIGRMTPTGTFTEFAIPTPASEPDDITAGPDGNLWFVEAAANKIGRITPAGVITEFPIPTPDSNPQGITAGPDGNLWFTEFDGNKIGRMTTAGVFTEFPVRITTANAGAHHIRVGPDGNLWVPFKNQNKIARVTPAGVITEFDIPTAASQPLNVVAGPDGNLWFTEFATNKIGVLDLSSQILSMDPSSGISSGGTTTVLTGLGFEAGATVTIGGAAAGNVVVNSPTSIDAGSPALPPGTLNDVVVDNPSGSIGLLPRGWLSDFLDVPQSHNFHDFVERIFRSGITAGCGGGNYCPGDAVTRAQMAVFILTSEHGLGYAPPPATGTVFNDVSAGSFAAAFIEQLFAEEITGGCGGGNYCPNNPITRAQMSVFLLVAEHGTGYTPPPATGTVFTDVPVTHPFAAWIEQLFAEGITAGCGGGNYCPGNPVTRGQMAVFLVTTFDLP